MNEGQAEQLAQLREAYESGILDEATYQTSVRAVLGATQQAQATSGAAAQGERATAVGERGANVGGDVGGDVITGNVYHGEPAQDPEEALRIYRRVLVGSSGRLPLRGVDLDASDATAGQNPLGLANVYVDLDTTTQVPREGAKEETKERRERALLEGREETRPLPALEAAATNRRLVLLGDPGGGKSTFVNHLAHCLAAHALEPDAGWLDQLPHWPAEEAMVLPLVVVMRDFAAGLPDPLPPRAEPEHLWNFITRRLQAQNLSFAAPPLRRALDDGTALVLLDGLDEVQDAQRAFVRDAVVAFAGRHHGRTRYLVTSRTLSYEGAPELRLPAGDYLPFELAPFDAEKIDRFIAAWYVELARLGTVQAQDVDGLTRQLQAAVRRPDLWRLAPNPLLLTVMALVHTHKGRLPDARALLYEDTVDVLLWRWEQVKAGGREEAPRLRQLLLAAERTDMDLKKVVWRLAYEAHAQVGETDEADALADVGELKLEKALAGLKDGDRNWAHRVILAMRYRAGLLLEREPGLFTFPHRTFQEYLAGAHLSARRNFARHAADLAGEGAAWREVILLAVGRLVYLAGDTEKPLALANRLCPATARDEPVAWRRAWLAGDVLLEMGLKRVRDDDWGEELLARTRQRLAALVAGGKLAPRERMEAGDTLAGLGDPRPGVCTPEPDLIEIPAGTFLMGEEKHEIHLDAFAIARHLVTNAQFRHFIEDGGYTEKWRHCWTEEGWQEREEGDWRRPRLWHDEQWNRANQPVVAVSWYEAVAYANWLRETTGNPYRLPTEAEWERTARHTDGREYPWGEEWREDVANAKETGLERTTAVGAFPAGAAECGALGMSGNVWEWCQTRWRDEEGNEYPMPYKADDGREELSGSWRIYRVLRGGSWYESQNALRCAARDGDSPYYGNVDFGIRVAVSPVTSGL